MVLLVGSIIKTLVEVYGTQYILPLGAKIAPDHLPLPVNPVILVVSAVLTGKGP